ncbi:hypothetical protein [Pseudonocardia spirodelae]|uniref:LPXTG cell wall anchor domain-containing protein n=1 Tax=Pseudonocardia spirodelae TaxID=3133431 RepID=A0ABU8T7L4_9PSEU
MSVSVRSARPVPVAVVAAVVGAGLLLVAAATGWALPATATARNWDVVWAGLDVGTAAAALATAALLRAGDVRAALTATAGAALLVTDAWFDVTTAAGTSAAGLAVAEAVLLELPLALGGVLLATRLLRTHR